MLGREMNTRVYRGFTKDGKPDEASVEEAKDWSADCEDCKQVKDTLIFTDEDPTLAKIVCLLCFHKRWVAK